MTFGDPFRDRTVFVTGHTGFKGTWLSLWLAELGARVHGYSLDPPTAPNLFDETNLRSRLASHTVADIRDIAALTQAMQATKPEIVLHLAAQALVRRAYREPRETYETNVMGTVNILEAVRATDRVRVCLIVTSDKCYENRGWVYPYRENDSMGGADPYSSSKGCAELVVDAYRRSFFDPDDIERHGVSLASARAGNVIGGGDWAEDRIIPDCIRALAENRTILVRNPRAIRPWQHVLEPLAGYLQLVAAQSNDPAAFAQGWNFGPLATSHMTVQEVTEEVIRNWGGGVWQTAEQPQDRAALVRAASFHEDAYLKLDITKAVSRLGWRPLFTTSEAISETVRWYYQRTLHAEGFDASEMCVKQIQMYTRKAKEQGLAWAILNEMPLPIRELDTACRTDSNCDGKDLRLSGR
jgi:CDP-glucose 4,6-dehydratase